MIAKQSREQRSNYRLSVGGSLRLFDQNQKEISGKVLDLSLGGVQVSLGQEISLNDYINDHSARLERRSEDELNAKDLVVRFKAEHTPDGCGEVELKGTPVWCAQNDGDQRIGFSWGDLSTPKRLMIKHWLRYYAA